ncbi:hypothetical protein [Bacillus xiapuensis]|uniref:Uncharacterized protein n=1 Tax=Bacillus xiapuensis TaxID=2014075 RepID=A0ABU6NEC5_9BACI|nr:hypothetical protein [Bacillus xiapuensis]
MDFYENLPIEFLIRFYKEILHNVEEGILSKKMYYELGLIISVASRKGISLDFPADFKEEVNEEVLMDLLHLKQLRVG